MYLLPDNTAHRQSHIFSHQLDFSTWCLHRFLKLNRTKISHIVFPRNAAPFVGLLALFTELITAQFGSHPQFCCSTHPSNSWLLRILTHNNCLICVLPSIPAITLVILTSPIILNWPFCCSSCLRCCPPPICLPHDSYNKLFKGHVWLKTHQLLSLPSG